MKYFNILATLLLISVFSFYSCKDNAETKKQDSKISLDLENSTGLPSNATPTTTTPIAAPDKPVAAAQNAAGVWHYTCNKGCAGGGGKAGNCAVCGGPLAHNKAYHAKGDNDINNINNININNATNTPTTTQTSPIVKPPTEPAQNAAGVWHFTCAKGCAGGAGAKGTCGSCGGALAHNKEYHK